MNKTFLRSTTLLSLATLLLSMLAGCGSDSAPKNLKPGDDLNPALSEHQKQMKKQKEEANQ